MTDEEIKRFVREEVERQTQETTRAVHTTGSWLPPDLLPRLDTHEVLLKTLVRTLKVAFPDHNLAKRIVETGRRLRIDQQRLAKQGSRQLDELLEQDEPFSQKG